MKFKEVADWTETALFGHRGNIKQSTSILWSSCIFGHHFPYFPSVIQLLKLTCWLTHTNTNVWIHVLVTLILYFHVYDKQIYVPKDFKHEMHCTASKNLLQFTVEIMFYVDKENYEIHLCKKAVLYFVDIWLHKNVLYLCPWPYTLLCKDVIIGFLGTVCLWFYWYVLLIG